MVLGIHVMFTRELKLKRNRKLDRESEKFLWQLTGVCNWAIKTIDGSYRIEQAEREALGMS